MTTRSEDEYPSLVDATRLREEPTTARGVRTRNALVAAARRVFERDGFIDSRLVDITAEAQCSVGTFYTYFDSKEEIFTAVMQAAQDDMMHPGLAHADGGLEALPERFAASNRAYLQAYTRNAKLMLLLEQVATIDPAFRQLRVRRSEAFAERNAKLIRDLQDQGYADPTLEPRMTARALSSMISRLAYYSFALEQNWSIDELERTITQLWLNALGIPPDGSRRPAAD